MEKAKKITIEQCSACDCGKKKIIVNKHFFLCQQKNDDRLNDKKTNSKRFSDSNRSPKPINRNKPLRIHSKKKRSIAHVSSKNRYRTSWNDLVTQEEINKRYAEVCLQIDQERESFCEATGRTDLPLSHSHTIPQRTCKNLGKAELIWDKDNIFLESMGATDSGHYIWENSDLEEKKKLFNFERKVAYIKLHDRESYNKLIVKLDGLEERKEQEYNS